MCKCINPCICIPSGTASFMVAVIDVVLGIGTLYGSWLSYKNLEVTKDLLRTKNIEDDVLWFGMITIPLVAVIGVWSGLKLLYCLCRRSQESNHVLKFCVFFIAEVVGFIAPFYIYQDYVLKIKAITSNGEDVNFLIFRLLEVNPVTILLFLYQILSFWAVHRHQLIKRPSPIKNRTSGPALLRSPANTDHSDSIPMVQLSADPRQKIVPGRAHPKMYPDLKELKLDILPSHSSIRECEQVSIDMDDSDSEDWLDVHESSALRLQRPMNRGKPISKFELLRQRCLQNGTLFTDEEFPACQASIGSGQRFQWKRPHDLEKGARFFTDGASRFDVRQGSLGDCWFLAAVDNLTLNDELFKQAVPCDNEWADGGGYVGICHFRFWTGNEWKDVIIDDRLPTRNGKLTYLTSSDPTEFWSSLLEKAYAKLNGSYANLCGNDGIGRAMENLTGGKVTRHYIQEFYDNSDKIFKLIFRAMKNGKLVGCCISQKPSKSVGLYEGHAYSITAANNIKMRNGTRVPALRIRNPWGSENEWEGKFSDSHPIWESVDKKMKKELQLIFRADGEFWVPLDDFMNYFNMFEICHLP